MSLLRAPQRHPLRRALWQIHVWTGVAVAAYAALLGVTGAVLVFRPELQARMYPAFFARWAPGDALAPPEAVIAALRARYPDDRFRGLDYPHARRGTFLIYTSHAGELRTVFADARTGRVIGELPRDGWPQRLQELHFNLWLGDAGFGVNGAGAALLLVLCVTGLVVWWPGAARWTRALTVDARRAWRRVTWELHRATGFWTVALIAMWALTGVYFSFPGDVRRLVGLVLPLEATAVPRSVPGASSAPRPAPADLVARARGQLPGAQVARLMLPGGDTGSYAVVLAARAHGDGDASDEVTFYFDQYSGRQLARTEAAARPAGERVLSWLAQLHMGTFGGFALKAIWAALSLALPLLGATGLVMWWNRVVRRGLREPA